MNEEVSKLIARIQHFYDVMGQIKEKTECEMMEVADPYSRAHSKLLADAYGELTLEYQKVFGSILYQE